MNRRIILMSLFATCCGLAAPSIAQDGQSLTVERSDGSEITYSLTDLEGMKQVIFTTSTIWTDGEVIFRGVPLRTIMDEAGAGGKTVRMSALNDYVMEMPVSELGDNAPIVATRMNGKTMSIRDKGPFWVMYPYDAAPDFKTETNYARSVWQLVRLTFVE